MADDKQTLRKAVWAAIKDAGAGRFPGIAGRIPNFIGAEAAGRRLAETAEFRAARTIKSNPDSPQRTVRHLALKAGKTVFVAVPKLAEARPFVALVPDELGAKNLWAASSIKGAAELGRPVAVDEMPAIDLIVTGCVGVTPTGARLGKGGGYADLEYGLLREAGLVDEATPIATVLHPVQRLATNAFDLEAHDTTIDLFATPDEVVRIARVHPRPAGILWEALLPEKIAAIPVLRDRADSV